jgi:hydrogenase nickel incorporation protein HypA/HybF
LHEYGVVESLVRVVLHQLEGHVERVEAVRFRRGSAFSEDALRQAFEVLSAGTILEGAEVYIETVNLDFHCRCGHEQVITSDDLIGHMFVCPTCGAVKEIDEAHDLELIDLTVREASTSIT